MKITIKNQSFDFAAAVNLMDDDLRETLNATMAPCSAQDFVNAYCQTHLVKFGAEFIVN